MSAINSKRNLLVFLAIVVALSLGGILYYRKYYAAEKIKPRMGPVIEAVYGLGTVMAPQTYQVKTAVNQRISDVFVKEGDEVKINDPLLKFDESGIARAPFAGAITSVPFKKGELLFPGSPALTLVNLKDLYIEVSLEQQSVLRVSRSQEAKISFENLRGEKISGKVESVYPRDTQFIVRITMDKFPPGILPGMTADVAIEVGRKENVLSIPILAISGGFVTILREGKKIKEQVKLGVVDGEWGEVVSSNINPDDQIFVRPK